MKRLIPACICLTAALLLSVGSFCLISQKTDEFCEKIDNAILLDDESIEEEVINLCKDWSLSEKVYGALLKHSDADELENCFLLLEYYASAGTTDELRKALFDCKKAFTVIRDGEKPAIANIF